MLSIDVLEVILFHILFFAVVIIEYIYKKDQIIIIIDWSRVISDDHRPFLFYCLAVLNYAFKLSFNARSVTLHYWESRAV